MGTPPQMMPPLGEASAEADPITLDPIVLDFSSDSGMHVIVEDLGTSFRVIGPFDSYRLAEKYATESMNVVERHTIEPVKAPEPFGEA